MMARIDVIRIEDARKQIDRLAAKNEKVVVVGKSIEFNRKILESKKVSGLILSHTEKHDKLKQRDSGLNQVLCKIAKENNISLIIDFNEFQNLKEEEKARVLSRIIQNIKLAKKYKNSLKVINYKDKYDAKALLLTLGMPTTIIKAALN